MKTLFKILSSAIFLTALYLHIFCDTITIDAIGIILLCLVFIPWIIDKIQSMKIPGVGEVVFVVKDTKKKDVDEHFDYIDFPTIRLDEAESKYIFYSIRNQDTRLALAGLRIEIESKLQKIAQKNDVEQWKMSSVSRLERLLFEHRLIDSNESAIIRDMINILNDAVHNKSDQYDANSINWIFKSGIKLLASLEKKTRD